MPKWRVFQKKCDGISFGYMFIAIDETGQFRDQTGKNIGIVTLVTITESEWLKFLAFANKTVPQGLNNSKGKTLTAFQRERVLKYIGSKPEIKYTAYLYDLSGGNDQWVEYHKSETIRKAEDKIKVMGNRLKPSYVKDLRLYLNQLGNYSVGDYAKFVMFTELFTEWQRFFQFDYVYTHIKNDSWHMHFIIDTQNQPNKFVKLVQATLKLTTSELNPNYGIYTPKEWIADHPFIEYHSKDGDTQRHDGQKFYEDFVIGNEQDNLQLFLPDIIGHTLLNSILRRKEKRWLMNLKRLKQNRSLTITNKFKNPDGYYHITGFDKSKDPKDVLPMVKEHYKLMRYL